MRGILTPMPTRTPDAKLGRSRSGSPRLSEDGIQQSELQGELRSSFLLCGITSASVEPRDADLCFFAHPAHGDESSTSEKTTDSSEVNSEPQGCQQNKTQSTMLRRITHATQLSVVTCVVNV